MNRRLITIVASVVVAALLGAGGVLLGRLLAPEAVPAATAAGTGSGSGTGTDGVGAPQRVNVPVLGPVGYGEVAPVLGPLAGDPGEDRTEPGPSPSGTADPSVPLGVGPRAHVDPPAPDPGVEDEGPTVSPVIGTVELPADDEGAPDLGEALLEGAERTGAADPEDAPWGIEVVGDADGEGSGDDECAPTSGEPGADCPDGLMGEIFAVEEVDLWLYGSSTVHEPDPELPVFAVQCPSVETTADAIQFGFAASAPGTVEMTYGPRDGAETTTIRLTLTADQIADWEVRTAATPADAAWTPSVQYCTVIAGLDKYTGYEFTATITDEHGNTAPSSGHFRLPEDRVRPPAQIRPIGEGVLYTALAHKPEDTVQITYHVLDDGETPDCAAPSDRLEAPVGRRTAVAVTPLTEEYLAANGYLPGYTERMSWITTVPEGSDVLVCFSELKADRPTWEWLDAQWRTWAVVATPDHARPAVTADSVSLLGEVDVDAIDVTVSWGTVECSLVHGPSARGNVLELAEDRRPCDGGDFPPTQVDPLVQVSVRHDGETYRSHSVLPLSRIGKTGGGAVPETTWFTVPLTVEVDHVEMCGSGIQAPCSRIEGYGMAGTVMLRVDWSEGASNGRDDWHVGELRSERVEHELAALPQVDYLRWDWEILSTAPNGGPVTARYVVGVDRPVDYQITLVGSCTIDGEEMTRSGNVRTSVPLQWRLCPGERYHLEGTFADEDGNTAVYDGSDTWAVLSSLTTPRYDTRLSVAYRAEHTAAGGWEGPNVLLAAMRLRIDGQDVDLGVEPRECLSGPVIDRSAGIGLRDVRLSQDVRIELSVLMVESWGGYGGGEPPTCTGAVTWGVPTVDLVADVSLADLREGMTIKWEGDTDYAVTLTLQDYGPAT